eukprot:1617848-Karenia_brevis.AAC.1
MCHLLELMISYDQLDASNLASAEVACRQVPFAEERWKERVIGQQEELVCSQFLFSGAATRGSL